MSLLSKLQSLLSAANTKTGASDTTLTAAVARLIAGYGGGGGGGGNANVITGTFTTLYTSGADRGASFHIDGLSLATNYILIFKLSKTEDEGGTVYDPPKMPSSYTYGVGAIISSFDIAPPSIINSSGVEAPNANGKYYYLRAAGTSTSVGNYANHETNANYFVTVDGSGNVSLNADARFGALGETWTYAYTAILW